MIDYESHTLLFYANPVFRGTVGLREVIEAKQRSIDEAMVVLESIAGDLLKLEVGPILSHCCFLLFRPLFTASYV